ncbi:MAG TPA: glutamine--fructose-6-phosphate transaminase (isomerizing) [Glaciihabitans sp.]|jgi:glucosamine--fructose-6-phosphate aminotransferase (isomerizing)|nr:glutamine--fructose-6-phosphate transaminase (isomerizing) [Glaciihabitans sp.]
MCGIVGCRTSDDAAPYLLRALSLLEYRGYDSVGVAIRTDDGGTATVKTVNRVDALSPLIEGWQGSAFSGTGIGHTRWATHGMVTETNAHPHADCSGRISVVHNGIIENADALRDELQQAGHRFASEVDSEVVTHLVEDALAETGDLLSSVSMVLPRLEGSWALVVLDATSGLMVATAHRSPLLVARTAKGDFVASDIGAIAEWAEDYWALRDGDLVEIGEEFVWMNGGAHFVPPHPIRSVWTNSMRQLIRHTDYMDKEIDEQPEVAARILDQLGAEIASGKLWRSTGVPAFDRVAVLGCGTSLNAGRVIGTAFSRLGGIAHDYIVASEASTAVLAPNTLVMAISQSGETADILRAIDELGLTSSLIALTNNPHSTLARQADSIVNCSAGPEIGVAATKTFVAQVVTGVAYALSSLADSGRMTRREAQLQVDDLNRIPDLLAQSIAVSREAIPEVVADVRDATGFVFLGRGSGVVYAGEGALKLKELTYRWAEHYPAGELKHGPLALIENGTPVVVIDNGDPRLASNIAEVAARGGLVIRIGGQGSTIPALGHSFSSPLRGGMDQWGPLESVAPLQILARELALSLGRDVDKPRNLAKSVTVE